MLRYRTLISSHHSSQYLFRSSPHPRFSNLCFYQVARHRRCRSIRQVSMILPFFFDWLTSSLATLVLIGYLVKVRLCRPWLIDDAIPRGRLFLPGSSCLLNKIDLIWFCFEMKLFLSKFFFFLSTQNDKTRNEVEEQPGASKISPSSVDQLPFPPVDSYQPRFTPHHQDYTWCDPGYSPGVTPRQFSFWRRPSRDLDTTSTFLSLPDRIIRPNCPTFLSKKKI